MQFRLVGLAVSALLGGLWTTAWAQESALVEAQGKAKASPTSPEASLAFGRALRRAGRETEALAELRRGFAAAAGRADPAARTRLTWETARTHVARRDFTSAMTTCRAMAPTAKAASHACAAEAHLLWRRGTEAATELAAIANLKSVPADVEVAVRIAEGRIAELSARDSDAEASYRAAIALAPEQPEPRVLLGVMLQRLGKDGGPSLRRAVELDPREPTAQFELGRALATGSAESLAALERAVSERPTYTEALRALSEGYVAARRLPDAKRTAEAALKLAPNDVLSHVIAGRVALAEGRADKAIEEGETASKLMPNAAAARLLVADAWAHKGEIDLAIEAYQAAVGLDRTDPAALVNATLACVAAGRTTSAKAFGRRAVQDFPQHAGALVALGDALSADKDLAAARASYEGARKLPGADLAAIDAKLAKLR
jgi:tetratricopeptide (TPR) repeat protein